MLLSPLDPVAFFTNMAKSSVKRIMVAVPSLLGGFAQAGTPIGNVLYTVSGGAALDDGLRETVKGLTGAEVYEGYGSTECGPVISCQTPAQPGAQNCVGFALDGVEVEIRSSDGNKLPANEIGEIVIRTRALMSGYYDLAKATRSSIKGGWFHTEDLGYLDEAGSVFIVDRLTDVLTVKGITVLPQTIEKILNSHDAVHESAVVGIPDGGGGEMPWAFVKSSVDSKPEVSELIDYMRARLPIYAVPRGVEFRDELPKTITGKILKRTLRQKWL